ncbi:hypothetical protein M0D69_07175 [Caballeronia sp. SEWSISQ10-4 2]|uniref:hypothetical protein n=1 Tax=Caballeronia sp. SEWSISQ10-4 2 TaxID=2937438 RepID=UPI002653893A|nr:hypothetical protein [Caballeronia sp. SEWSISQ10-4 2]MDN7177804.1 hypothetical protein [Caballeronia sp. SEWSISQ10-4 2]
MYFLLPDELYYRFQAYTWNRQSALLQEVKARLAQTYPNTDMSGDELLEGHFLLCTQQAMPAASD